MFQSTRPRGARHTANVNTEEIATVSIHAPTRGATAAFRPSGKCLPFQSTRPRGARRMAGLRALSGGGFNPRAHAGRDTRSMLLRTCSRTVSIHAPTRGATARRPRHAVDKLFQSTRPRGARHLVEPAPIFVLRVSIHAPTRGATSEAMQARRSFEVSIHAPTRGATDAVDISARSVRFQSTRPRGARRTP